MKIYQSPELEIRFFKTSDVLESSDPQTPIEPWSFRRKASGEEKMNVFTK